MQIYTKKLFASGFILGKNTTFVPKEQQTQTTKNKP
jgi:hypothetical protein